MKMTGAGARRYLRAPDPGHAALLIFGADAMRVADARQQAIQALIGPAGADEMRLTRIAAADLRKDPALLLDALKAQGFFPGHRVAFVEEAGDGLAKVIGAALQDWQPGDAQLVITAGALTAKSALRKLIEARPDAAAIGLYDDPPNRDEVAQALGAAGLRDLAPEVTDQLTALATTLEPGDFRQMLDKIGLYMLGEETPLSLADVAACAPQSTEADVDDLLNVVADGQPEKVGPLMRNLAAQGVAPVTLCIGANRHFRRLHSVAADPGGPASGIGRLRPPVFGPRRDALLRQAKKWGREKAERALTALTDTDLQLRSAGQTAPPAAIMERTLIRLAMMVRR